VLLSTNIVEAGLDIPNANTMLIWRPDRFGLAQLHQLRGRVGRGGNRGVVYLLTDPNQEPTPAAKKRLQALAGLSNLGAGFAISAADLDMRGAGELLGEAQSGNIRLIGTELYQDLMSRALATAKGEGPAEGWEPEIHAGISCCVPPDLVPEPDTRLEIYRRVARLKTDEAINGMAEELADRFGDLPEPLQHLLELRRLALRCRMLNIVELQAGPDAVAVRPQPLSGLKQLEKLLGGDIPIRRAKNRLLLKIREQNGDRRLQVLLNLLPTAPEYRESGSRSPEGATANA
jgi:transcription-repair coupling factor (superfamily II helicase)